MKNKRLHHRAILLLLLLLVLSFAIGLRITRLNGSYLATEDCYGYPQKPIEWNGLKIELIGAEIVDGEAFYRNITSIGNQFFGFPVRKVRTVSYICDEGVGFPIVDILSF